MNLYVQLLMCTAIYIVPNMITCFVFYVAILADEMGLGKTIQVSHHSVLPSLVLMLIIAFVVTLAFKVLRLQRVSCLSGYHIFDVIETFKR